MWWEWDYPPDDDCARTARRDVLRCLKEARVDDSLWDDVQLVVSELVANAVRHAATDCTVSILIGSEHVRVEVFDGDARPPSPLAAGPDATWGRGLVIVTALAATWGYETTERDGTKGKTVWAEFERTAAPVTSMGAAAGGR
jgi:anti-sigma regulatory factor (Ser/Thr protein kinase)